MIRADDPRSTGTRPTGPVAGLTPPAASRRMRLERSVARDNELTNSSTDHLAERDDYLCNRAWFMDRRFIRLQALDLVDDGFKLRDNLVLGVE